MHTFHEEIGGDEYLLVWVMEYGAVIAYAVLCTLIFDLDIFCEMINQTKFTYFLDVHASVG